MKTPKQLRPHHRKVWGSLPQRPRIDITGSLLS